MDLAKWQSTSLPKGLVERIDVFLESKEAYKMGITTRAQFLSTIVRDFLEKWEATKSE